MAVTASCKTILFLFNIVFSSTGLMLLIAGLFAEFAFRKYIDVTSEFGTGPLVLIGIASLITLTSSIAYSCIAKGQSVLLYIYGGFLCCIFVMYAGVAAAVAVHRSSFTQGLHAYLIQSLTFDGPVDFLFIYAQSKLHCCGVSNYTDWLRLSRVIPDSCCKNATQCVTVSYDNVYQRGCYQAILQFFESYQGVLCAAAAGAALLPLAGAVLSCGLARHLHKSKYLWG